MDESPIRVKIHGQSVEVNRQNYTSLFGNSVVHRSRSYHKSLEKGSISFVNLQSLARRADMPYVLFFAPQAVVKANLDRKTKLLLEGVSKTMFSMNSRGSVLLCDIELIIKDIIRKQGLLKKHDKTIGENPVLGCLKGSSQDFEEQSNFLRRLVGIDLDVVEKLKKEDTFYYIASLLEQRNIFVSQSSNGKMPQLIHKDVSFSGVCVRDRKAPFIFLNNKDSTLSFEPDGRRVFTLVLLAVCLSKANFMPVSYDEVSRDLITPAEYCITENVLMPAQAVQRFSVTGIEDIKSQASIFSVTPSAYVMRLRRLKIINSEATEAFLQDLEMEFANRKKPQPRTPTIINGLRKYNGVAYPKAIISYMDAGLVSRSEARRVLLQNRLDASYLDEFRG